MGGPHIREGCRGWGDKRETGGVGRGIALTRGALAAAGLRRDWSIAGRDAGQAGSAAQPPPLPGAEPPAKATQPQRATSLSPAHRSRHSPLTPAGYRRLL